MAREPVADYFHCPIASPKGGPHQYVYLGRQAQAYFCTQCNGGISKADLKRATDSSEISSPSTT